MTDSAQTYPRALELDRATKSHPSPNLRFLHGRLGIALELCRLETGKAFSAAGGIVEELLDYPEALVASCHECESFLWLTGFVRRNQNERILIRVYDETGGVRGKTKCAYTGRLVGQIVGPTDCFNTLRTNRLFFDEIDRTPILEFNKRLPGFDW